MHAVDCRRELHLVWRRSRDVVIGCGIVVDFAQRNAFAAPPAFERAGVHVVDQDPLIEEPVGDEDFARLFVQFEGPDARRKRRRLLVVGLHLVGRHFRPTVAKIAYELPVPGELNDAVARSRARQIYVLLTVDRDGLQPPGPPWMVTRPAPPVHHVPVRIEFDNLRPQHATFATRRVGRRGQFVRTGIDAPGDHPDVIVPVDIDVDDLLHAPFVGQWLGPERVYAVLRRGGRALLRADDGEHYAGKDTNGHRKEALGHGAVI